MTDTDTLILDLQPVARSIAKSFARSYPPCDADDIEQSLMLWLFEHRAQVAGVYKDDRIEKPREAMRKQLQNVATVHCRGERAAAGVIHNAYWYRPSDVRDAIAYWFDYGYWNEYAQTGGPEDGKHVHGARTPNTGGSRTGQVIWHNDRAEGLAVLGDISRCYDRLTGLHRGYLENVHIEGAQFDNDSAERRGYDRAIDALTELMNGVR